jgi:NADH-quinone oxidoreductase subunit N
MLFLNEFYFLLPECYLLYSILSLIWLSVIYTTDIITIGKLLSIQIGILCLSVLGMLLLLSINSYELQYLIINNSLIINKFSKVFVLLIVVGLTVIINLALFYIKNNNLKVAELFLIFLIILLGFIILVYANDFIIMYMGIELQSLGLYILATLKQNSIYATEAGLKYFVLGSVASCLLILGISIIYSFTGLNTFIEINLFFQNNYTLDLINIGTFIGFLLVLISLLFKIGSAPFHIWLPDVYEGVSTIITTFFALIPKLVIFTLIIKLFFIIQDLFILEFNYLMLVSSILSIIIGSIGALYQKTIKRLLSYSAINHTGFILLGITIGNLEGLVSVFFYLIIYYLIIISIFSIVLQIQQKENGFIIKYINNLVYIYNNNKILGISLILIFFTLAGIPPLSGFFSKLYLFLALLNQQYILIALIVSLFSVIGCVYYLKIIRNIIFLKKKKKIIY